MNGQGIYTNSSGIVLTGEFKDDKINGLGKLVYTNGDVYEGNFTENKMNGQGIFNFHNE